jgi:1,2-diacylglycerol 3-beta-glucosyltransferase
VQARKTASNAQTNVLTRCQRYEFALDGYLQAKRDTIFGAVELRGNGMVIRRSALEELGGFNENNLTEDLDLCTRMHAKGWDLRYASDVQVWEEAMPAVLPLMKQRVRWTEGSLIRYLEHANEILWNPKVAWRTKLDLVQFVFECILPVWLFTEIGLMMIRWWQGALTEMPTLYAVPAAVVLSFYFVIVAFQGVGRFDKPSILQSLIGALSVYTFLTFLWMPIVFIVLIGILSRSQRNSVWVKTEHFGGNTQ